MTSGTVEVARDRAHRLLGDLELRALDPTDIEDDRRLVGDDVRPGAAADDAGVHGHARPATVEPVERDDLVCGLEDRAAALVRLDAGVGGAAVDGHPQVHHPLPRRHDVAVLAGALEHERHVGVAGQLAR